MVEVISSHEEEQHLLKSNPHLQDNSADPSNVAHLDHRVVDTKAVHISSVFYLLADSSNVPMTSP